MAGKSATDFDRRLGERITEFRTAADMRQRQVADALGVSAAQLQKYERGSNCLKASSLPILADLFGRRIEDFFDPAPPAVPPQVSVSDAAHMLADAVQRVERSAELMRSTLADAASDRGRADAVVPVRETGRSVGAATDRMRRRRAGGGAA